MGAAMDGNERLYWSLSTEEAPSAAGPLRRPEHVGMLVAAALCVLAVIWFVAV
jgi:hypothetical protein